MSYFFGGKFYDFQYRRRDRIILVYLILLQGNKGVIVGYLFRYDFKIMLVGNKFITSNP